MPNYSCNTEGCSIGDCQNCLAVAELRAERDRNARRIEALAAFLDYDGSVEMRMWGENGIDLAGLDVFNEELQDDVALLFATLPELLDGLADHQKRTGCNGSRPPAETEYHTS